MGPSARSEIASYELSSERIDFDRKDLERIIEAAIGYLTESEIEHRAVFVGELQAGSPVLNSDGEWQRGAWRLQVRDGELALVRYPPRGPVMYFFVLRLRKDGGAWYVSSYDEERLHGR